MKEYIATFYSHYGALSYYKILIKQDISAKLMPVPRSISSSCGTCVSFASDSLECFPDIEIEAIYIEDNGKFSTAWVNDN